MGFMGELGQGVFEIGQGIEHDRWILMLAQGGTKPGGKPRFGFRGPVFPHRLFPYYFHNTGRDYGIKPARGGSSPAALAAKIFIKSEKSWKNALTTGLTGLAGWNTAQVVGGR